MKMWYFSMTKCRTRGNPEVLASSPHLRQCLRPLNQPPEQPLLHQRVPLSDIGVDLEKSSRAFGAKISHTSLIASTDDAQLIRQRVPRCVVHRDSFATVKRRQTPREHTTELDLGEVG